VVLMRRNKSRGTAAGHFVSVGGVGHGLTRMNPEKKRRLSELTASPAVADGGGADDEGAGGDGAVRARPPRRVRAHTDVAALCGFRFS
jgi:hypothetical protein